MITLKEMEAGVLNLHGQRLLMKTDRPALGQTTGTVDVLECVACGYIYAASPRVAPRKKCPNCQGGK